MADLLPCPFCSGTDLSSGGDDKFVGYSCRTCQATGPNHYGSRDWNTRPAAPVDDELTIPRSPTEAMMDAGLYHCSHDMQWSDLYTAWQAMFDAVILDGGLTEKAKASAAPVEGLEIVGHQYGHPHSFTGHVMWSFKETWMGVQYTQKRELVVRSQAEAIIAAEVKRERELAEKQLSEVVNRMSDDYLVLKADNAALTARVKELEKLCNDTEAEALGYASDKAELEAKLAAANKALEFYRDGFKYHPKRTATGINISEWKPTNALLEDCGETARAALEAKP